MWLTTSLFLQISAPKRMCILNSVAGLSQAHTSQHSMKTKGIRKRNVSNKRQSITNLKWNNKKAEEFNEAIHSDETQETFEEALDFFLIQIIIAETLKTFNNTLPHAGECMRRTVSFSTGA